MNGIQTQSGIDLWLNGQREFVREFDRAFVDTVDAPTKIIMFANSHEGENIVPGGTGLTLPATKMDTTLKSEGQFATADFVATHLGIGVDLQVVSTTGAAADVLTILADTKELAARAWFSMYFTSGNQPHDEGDLRDFPEGKGFTGFGGLGEVPITAQANWLSNGPPTQDALRPMKKPYRCTEKTRPRLEVEFPQGKPLPTIDMSIKATVHGFK